MNPTHDVAVIGAGPIGVEMAVALKKAGVDYVQFDAKQVGYTISWFAPGTRFFSSNERIAIAGVPLDTPDQNKATREQYLAYLRTVVRMFDLKIRTYEPVVGIERSGECFTITTTPRGGTSRTRARKLILCTGGTDRPRTLDAAGADLPHVDYYFRDPHTYFGQKLLIVGGKNSAVEAALRCHSAGADVTISYRRVRLPDKSIKYWLLPEINGLIEAGKIRAHFSTMPRAISPTHVTLSRCDENFCPRGDDFDVEADFILALIGYEQDDALLKLAGVETAGRCAAPVVDPATMQSNVPDVYIAGTATGGTQDKYTVFIENCHVHVARILAAITGSRTEAREATFAEPES